MSMCSLKSVQSEIVRVHGEACGVHLRRALSFVVLFHHLGILRFNWIKFGFDALPINNSYL